MDVNLCLTRNDCSPVILTHLCYSLIRATIFLAEGIFRTVSGSIRTHCYILPHLRKESVQFIRLWRNKSDGTARIILPQRWIMKSLRRMRKTYSTMSVDSQKILSTLRESIDFAKSVLSEHGPPTCIYSEMQWLISLGNERNSLAWRREQSRDALSISKMNYFIW